MDEKRREEIKKSASQFLCFDCHGADRIIDLAEKAAAEEIFKEIDKGRIDNDFDSNNVIDGDVFLTQYQYSLIKKKFGVD